jgi:hypothetical protein
MKITKIICNLCSKDAGGTWDMAVALIAHRADIFPNGNFEWDLCSECSNKVKDALFAVKDSVYKSVNPA